jgi:hypothetical protein
MLIRRPNTRSLIFRPSFTTPDLLTRRIMERRRARSGVYQQTSELPGRPQTKAQMTTCLDDRSDNLIVREPLNTILTLLTIIRPLRRRLERWIQRSNLQENRFV